MSSGHERAARGRDDPQRPRPDNSRLQRAAEAGQAWPGPQDRGRHKVRPQGEEPRVRGCGDPGA